MGVFRPGAGAALEAEVRLRWRTVVGEPLPITGGLDLAISILQQIEKDADGQAASAAAGGAAVNLAGSSS